MAEHLCPIIINEYLRRMGLSQGTEYCEERTSIDHCPSSRVVVSLLRSDNMEEHWWQRIHEHPIFQNAGENSVSPAKPASSPKFDAPNRICVRNGLLFVSTSKNELRCIRVKDLKSGKRHETHSYLVFIFFCLWSNSADRPFQTFDFTVDFEVQEILANGGGEFLALRGAFDLAVVVLPSVNFSRSPAKLPARYPPYFRSQSYQILTDCHRLVSIPVLGDTGRIVRIRKIRWHPFSTTDSHLVVLAEDNRVR